MLEIGSSGSVGERGGNDPLYPERVKSRATLWRHSSTVVQERKI